MDFSISHVYKIIGAIVAGLIILLVVLLMPSKKCPECGKPLPKFGNPQNTKQGVAEGWTCQNCGCQVDRSGNRIIKKSK
jgi:transposase